MEIRSLKLNGKEFSFIVPINWAGKALVYDTNEAAYLIQINLDKELNNRISVSEVESILDWKYICEDVHDGYASSAEIMKYLMRKLSQEGFSLSQFDVEEILKIEELYCKLIGIIPD
jgi:hypothetical protein